MTIYRFDTFSFDADSGELRDGTRAVRLEPQPAKLLGALLERRGELVARDELRRLLWAEGTHVDFDRGLSYCVAQIRSALGETAASPRFIETLPKRGYRFVGAVRPDEPVPVAADREAVRAAPVSPVRTRRRWLVAALALAAVALAVAAFLSAGTPTQTTVAVARFDVEEGADAALADRLADAVTVRLAAEPARWGVIGNAALLRAPRAERDLGRFGSELGAELVLLGQVWRRDDGAEVLVHCIRIADEEHLWAERFRGDAASIEARVPDAVARAMAQIDRSRR